ncbi:MAG: sigma-70 family RNA polymerase sigma factor [Candidatus Pacebacteria bacterium]|nr:sigma-70 family RNA polymerase sigma factor [Candidatus Paceibacterota bacterium]
MGENDQPGVDAAVTDGELIKHYRSGDEAAFETLYNRYRKPLYSYLNTMLPGQVEVVDDLYQRVWMRILDKLPAYRDRQKFISWAFRIAHNLAIDHFRSENRRREALSERITSKDSQPSPDQTVDHDELMVALAKAVEDLPAEQREVFLLRRDGVSFKEIARIQATSINTALGRMRYAVARLRDALAEWRAGGMAVGHVE